MDAETTQPSGGSLTTNLERLFLSSVRFSGATALYGVEQIQTAVRERGELLQQMDRIGATFDQLTACLAAEFSHEKQNALQSFSESAGQVVRDSAAGLSAVDLQNIFRAAGKLAGSMVQAVRSNRTAGSRREEGPRLAADVLAT